ncbi:hypothetical protein [Nitrosopumilus spindle-shaped virus]|uniref:Uncharacterized protein n=1 Tax=Nitrosopumilus spindle-shaped virus TaxID=2508184 RepID=A0A514K323_9VIRU|nr:hypothetical protein [Nitrosopumilus spindle-shaped virus]
MGDLKNRVEALEIVLEAQATINAEMQDRLSALEKNAGIKKPRKKASKKPSKKAEVKPSEDLEDPLE